MTFGGEVSGNEFPKGISRPKKTADLKPWEGVSFKVSEFSS